MNRPMVRVAVPYILGIAVADAGWLPFWYALAACVSLLLLAAALKASRTVTLLPLLLGLGLTNQAFHLNQIPANDLQNQLGDGQQIVTLTGRLATTPEHRVSEIKGEDYWRSMVELDVTGIETDTQRLAVSGTVLVSASFRLQALLRRAPGGGYRRHKTPGCRAGQGHVFLPRLPGAA